MNGKNRVVKALDIETICYRYCEIFLEWQKETDTKRRAKLNGELDGIFQAMSVLGLGNELDEYVNNL